MLTAGPLYQTFKTDNLFHLNLFSYLQTKLGIIPRSVSPPGQRSTALIASPTHAVPFTSHPIEIGLPSAIPKGPSHSPPPSSHPGLLDLHTPPTWDWRAVWPVPCCRFSNISDLSTRCQWEQRRPNFPSHPNPYRALI